MMKKILIALLTSAALGACTLTPAPMNPSAMPEEQMSPTMSPSITGEDMMMNEGSESAAMAENEIQIKNYAYSPDPITVKPGATVTVVNNDSVQHSVTSDDGKSFDTGLFSQGSPATFTAPNAPGTYPYHCTIHPKMHGTLIVK